MLGPVSTRVNRVGSSESPELDFGPILLLWPLKGTLEPSLVCSICGVGIRLCAVRTFAPSHPQVRQPESNALLCVAVKDCLRTCSSGRGLISPLSSLLYWPYCLALTSVYSDSFTSPGVAARRTGQGQEEKRTQDTITLYPKLGVTALQAGCVPVTC